MVVGRVAYCSQVPWIMPASLRDNVTFQRPMQAARYNSVIDACALNHDLAELPAGDLTELGERGVNLSGVLMCVCVSQAAWQASSCMNQVYCGLPWLIPCFSWSKLGTCLSFQGLLMYAGCIPRLLGLVPAQVARRHAWRWPVRPTRGRPCICWMTR